MRIAIGDVHGCFQELEILLHNEYKINKYDQVYLVGDLISRGPNSLRVLEHLMMLVTKGYFIKPVLGNHELRLLSLYHNDFDLFEDYLDEYNCLDLLDGELDKIITFLEGMPYYYDTKDWIIVHAELGKEENYRQNDARAIFGSDKFSDLFKRKIVFNRMQVFGHTVRSIDDIIADTLILTNSSINIDGGCVYPDYGHLCALDLDKIIIHSVEEK